MGGKGRVVGFDIVAEEDALQLRPVALLLHLVVEREHRLRLEGDLGE